MGALSKLRRRPGATRQRHQPPSRAAASALATAPATLSSVFSLKMDRCLTCRETRKVGEQHVPETAQHYFFATGAAVNDSATAARPPPMAATPRSGFVDYHRRFRRMAHRLDTVVIGIAHECAVVGSMGDVAEARERRHRCRHSPTLRREKHAPPRDRARGSRDGRWQSVFVAPARR